MSKWDEVAPTLGALGLVNIECGTYDDEETGLSIPLGRVDLYYEMENGKQDAIRFLLDEKDAEEVKTMLEQMLGVLRAFTVSDEEATDNG